MNVADLVSLYDRGLISEYEVRINLEGHGFDFGPEPDPDAAQEAEQPLSAA